jgi:threonine dehydrogenase-like Zn-dependent dehydrogenase
VTSTAADELRLEAARGLGAARAIAVDTEDVVTAVRDVTGGMGADVVFGVASVVQTVPLALDLVRFRARCCSPA